MQCCTSLKILCSLLFFIFKDTPLLWQYNLLYLNIARLGFMNFLNTFYILG